MASIDGKSMRDVSTPSSAEGPEPAHLSFSDIEEFAEVVGSTGSWSEAGLDVFALARALGGRLEVADGPESLRVFAGDAPPRFEIRLPPMTSERRDRFTIAHELGHYFLHWALPRAKGAPATGRPSVFYRGKDNFAETQANVFASALLMPRKRFEEAASAQADDWGAVARIFGVSPAAARARAASIRHQ